MADGSKIEDKSAYDKEKNRLRFEGTWGQNQGTSTRGPNQWIPKLTGLFAFPVSNTTKKST